MPRTIAHRGSHRAEPENTLAAFAAAHSDGAEMVELDVRRTADGALAIFHDPEVARTSLSELTLAELRSASGIAVPVLEEVLAWATETGIGLDIELKEDGYVDQIVPLLGAFTGELLVTSFLDPVLTQVAALAPDLSLGLLLHLTTMGAVKRARQAHAGSVVVVMNLLTERLLETVTEAGIEMIIWDFLPTPDQLPWLGDPLISAVITDDIPGTRAALSEKG